MSNGFALSKGFLPLLVDPWPELNNATPSVQLHYRALSPNTGCSAPALRFGTLILMGTSHLDFSLRIGAQVPTFRARAQLSFTPPSCRMSSGQQSGRPPDLSRVNDFSPVSTSHQRFARARLSEPYLTGSSPAFSATLTTPAFDRRSLRWFEACP